MLRWSFLLLFPVFRFFDEVTTSFPKVNVTFAAGGPVVLVGAQVTAICALPLTYFLWYRLNNTSQLQQTIGIRALSIESCTMEDTGEYICASKGDQYRGSFNLTVVEIMSDLWVSATPRDLVLVEGHGGVSLKCSSSTLPPSVSWTWSRQQEEGGWQNVSTERQLTLTKAGESGRYRCSALSNTLGLQQNRTSTAHEVNIISLPMTDGDYVGVASLILAVLSAILLVLLLLRAWRQGALQGQVKKEHPVKEFPGGKDTKREDVSHTDVEGDVYINYEPTYQAYCDLDPTYRTGDDIYAGLS